MRSPKNIHACRGIVAAALPVSRARLNQYAGGSSSETVVGTIPEANGTPAALPR